MNLLVPILLLLMTVMYVSQPVDAAADQPLSPPDLQVPGPTLTGMDVTKAGLARQPAASAATEAATTSVPLPILSIEVSERVVNGSEAEVEAIESAGVLNRLELFEF
ncbi:hypothetical protein [Paraflavitalea pollutisoli]|uniref:hypothetical protein n=1 Tax=Paraflavitalea pollutisoli TaxID=3034143 RepID=UPI0023EC69AC|nr:hypothetical protein [Paraflavitalea sp. H1-2-19X]